MSMSTGRLSLAVNQINSYCKKSEILQVQETFCMKSELFKIQRFYYYGTTNTILSKMPVMVGSDPLIKALIPSKKVKTKDLGEPCNIYLAYQ